jgi:hypothetical protein
MVVLAGGGGGSVTVTGCSPATGVVGDTLTITGTGFAVGQAVLCGGVTMGSVTVVSATSITATIPAGVSGLVNVSVAGVTLGSAVTVAAFAGKVPIEAGTVGQDVPTTPQGGYAFGDSAYVKVSNDRVFATGIHSLKFPCGPDAAHADSWAEQRFTFGAYLTELWAEYELYVPANYTHRAEPGWPSNNKFLTFWRDTYSNLPDWLPRMEVDRNSNGTSCTRACSNYENDPGAYTTDIPSPQVDVGSLNSGVPFIGAGGLVVPGGWTRIRAHLKGSSGAGVADGVFEMWAGTTLAYRKNNGKFMGGGGVAGTNNALKNGYLLGAMNSGFTDATIFYVDDFVVYASDPGW